MKYFGKQSLSSFLSRILPVIWYLVLIGSALFGVILVFNVFSISLDDPVTSEIAKNSFFVSNNSWDELLALAPVWKSLLLFGMLAWFTAIVILLLHILKKAEHLFINFRDDVIFNKSNVQLMSKISKILIAFSILTFNFTSLLIAIFLLMACQIIRNGTALQEEHDLTV